jgi:hypothetical protein
LVNVLDSEVASDTSKIRAAAVAFDVGLRVYEMRQLARRVATLEGYAREKEQDDDAKQG